MRQQLKNFWWLAGPVLLVIALCFAPTREWLAIPAMRYNFIADFWAYTFLHIIGLLSLFIWLPYKVYRDQYIRALFVGIYGFLLICLSVGRADFIPRTENLTLFRLYQSPTLSYEQHVINLILRRGDWLTFEEECVRPLRIAGDTQVIGGNANSSYCKSLGHIEMAYGIRAKDLLVEQYEIMRKFANNISMGHFDYTKCFDAKRCLLIGDDRVAVATVNRELSMTDLWCYKADICIILPVLIRHETDTAALPPQPNPATLNYTPKEVYDAFAQQPFFTPTTCQFNPLCSLMQLVGAPVR